MVIHGGENISNKYLRLSHDVIVPYLIATFRQLSLSFLEGIGYASPFEPLYLAVIGLYKPL